jgi:transcriptional regulatory protein LevR
MLLDREMQLEILNELSNVYPSSINVSEKYEYGTDIYRKFVANLAYLRAHNLISKDSILTSQTIGDCTSQPHLPSITHIGMDFLADDGGLSAILGVVTIKFEVEQFRSILESMILSSALPTEQKNTIINALRELPAESIKHLTTRIVDVGWDNLDSLMTLLQNSLF